MKTIKSIKIIEKGKAISIQIKNGPKIRFHSNWLIDNILDSSSRDIINGQKLISFSNLNKNNYIKYAELDKSKTNITLFFLDRKKEVCFPCSWLLKNIYDKKIINTKGWIDTQIETWDSKFLKELPKANFNSIKLNNDSLLLSLLKLKKFGFLKIVGGNAKSGELLKIANLFGYVRETNYGKFFNVKSEVNAINLAYTSLGIDLHTDNPYRDPVPSIQILYCIENTAKGGNSIVADGFYAALLLKKKNPKFFDLLSKYNVKFEFKGDKKNYLQSSKPLIELSSMGEIISIRFNDRSIAPITDVPYKYMEEYYKAYRIFGDIINSKKLAVNFKLKPGESFLVDNTRVLHARTGFSSKGKRWLQGCYVDKDGLLSTISTLSKH